MFYAFMKFIANLASVLLFRMEAFNVDRMPNQGGILMVSNHASYVDPPLMGCRLSREMYTMAKSELFGIWGVSHFFRGCKAFPIRRQGVDRDALRHCVDLLKSGELVSIFPENSRTPDGELQEPKPGAGMMAVQAAVRCVPAYIDGSYNVWPKGRWYPLPSKIRIYYGEPFDMPERPEGMSKKDYYQYCSEEMMRHIAELKAQAELAKS